MFAHLNKLKGGAKGNDIVASVPPYIAERYPKYSKALVDSSVNIQSVATLLVPSDAWLNKWNKNREDVDTNDKDWSNKYAKLSAELKVLSLPSVAITKDYKGGVTRTKIGTEVRISEVKGKNFKIHSGEDGKTVAECELLDVMGAPTFAKGESRPRDLAIALIKSGEISTVSLSKDAATMVGGFELEVIDNDTNRIKMAIHQDTLANCTESNKDYYAPVVAGMLRYVEMHMSEFAEDAKKIGAFGGAIPMATFYALVQPFARNRQIISSELIKAWRGAPYYPSGGCAEYIRGFISAHQKGDDAARKLAADMFDASGMKLPEKAVLSKIKQAYSEHAAAAFGLGDSQATEKLWADSLAFAIYAALMGTSADRFRSAAVQAENADGQSYEDGVSILKPEKWVEWTNKESEAASLFVDNNFLFHTAGVIEGLPEEPTMNAYLRNFVKMNSGSA